MRRLYTLLPCAAAATLLLACAPAGADVFGPISLVSESAVPGSPHNQQASKAEASAISGDGRYVAFEGVYAGREGIFRRDLLTGEVATVVEGRARQPSISPEGRYISFTTTERLDEQNDTNRAPDVYVRDMEKPDFKPCPKGWEESVELRESCAFTLASAVNGSAQGLSYEYEGADEEGSDGSQASGRSALSVSPNGRYVAFVTMAVSNLANPERTGEPGRVEAPATPALQVAVRNLETRETKLVSVVRDPASGEPELNAHGQSLPVPSLGTGTAKIGAVYDGALGFANAAGGASISADGSTVAWMGRQIGAQAPVLPSDLASNPEYTEPLWRKVNPLGPTRRVTGGSDPTSPACVASGETKASETLSDPCQGPFEVAGGHDGGLTGTWAPGSDGGEDYLPQLSENGMTVAFLATAREIASGEEFGSGAFSDDLYVANMSDGLTRVQALRRLTELAGGNPSAHELDEPIVDLSVSPDGTQVAFTSKRTVFPLGSPAFVSPPTAFGMVELYDADLANDTLTRVTQGYEGQASEAPAGSGGFTDSPSFSSDGNLLAFSSDADNLVYGEGNQAGNVFVVPRLQFAATPTPEEFSTLPANPSPVPIWQLGVTAASRRDGSVLLDVAVPGGGTLSAGAQSAVLVRIATAARGSKRDKRAHATRATHASVTKLTKVATRTVASSVVHPGAMGIVAVALSLTKAYSSLAGAHGGLSATVSLTFTAPGHPTLHQSVAVTFVRTPAPRKAQSARARPRRGRAAKGRRR